MGPNRVRLAGSICALVTAWDASDELDLGTLKRLIEWHVQSGTDALVLAGSTGESTALGSSELELLWSSAVEYAAGRIRLIAGTGHCSTAKAVRLHALAERCGMHAGLVVTPAYVRPTQEGLYQHFSQVGRVGFPLILYNVPARTGCDLQPATVRRLQNNAAVIGIKEAVVDPARLRELASLSDPSFALLSGDDPTCLAALRLGFDGVISVAANVAPGRFADMVHAAQARDWSRAEKIERTLQPLYAALAVEPNPIPVKYAVAALGFGLDRLRLPLTRLQSEHSGALIGVLGLAQRDDVASAA